jgi:hypothetical protein
MILCGIPGAKRHTPVLFTVHISFRLWVNIGHYYTYHINAPIQLSRKHSNLIYH